MDEAMEVLKFTRKSIGQYVLKRLGCFIIY